MYLTFPFTISIPKVCIEFKRISIQKTLGSVISLFTIFNFKWWIFIIMMWLCILPGWQFEDTYENTQWGKVKQMQPMWSVCDERLKSPIEMRKRNLKLISPISRGEREIWISFPQFREEKEKSEKIFSTFEKRKRKVYSLLKLREEKEKFNIIYSYLRE